MNIEKLLKVFTAVMFVLTALSIILIVAFYDIEPTPATVASVHSDALTDAADAQQGSRSAAVIKPTPSSSEPELSSAFAASPPDSMSEWRYMNREDAQRHCRQTTLQGIEDLQRQMREPIDIKEHNVLSTQRESLRAMFEAC